MNTNRPPLVCLVSIALVFLAGCEKSPSTAGFGIGSSPAAPSDSAAKGGEGKSIRVLSGRLIYDGADHISIELKGTHGLRAEIVVRDPIAEVLAVGVALEALIDDIKGRFVLFDLNSTGGTFVNGQRTSQTVLYPGDVISLAGVALIFGQDNPPPRPDTGNTLPMNPDPGTSERPTATIEHNTVDLGKSGRLRSSKADT